MAQACASRSKRRARAFENPAAVAKKSTGHAQLREQPKSLHPELHCSEIVEYAFQRLSFDASKSQADRCGVSCKLTESLRFIRWLRFDKAAREITGQICAYPVLLRRRSTTRKSMPSGCDAMGGCRFSLEFPLANKRGTWLREDLPKQTFEKRDDEIITPRGAGSLRCEARTIDVSATNPSQRRYLRARRGKKPARSLWARRFERKSDQDPDQEAAALGARLRELRWKNSAWLATAETMAGWKGFEIRNAGSGRSPVRKRSG